MTSTAVRRQQREAAAPRELQLVNWPLRDRAPVSWLAVAVAVAAAVTVSAVAASPASGLAAFAAIALAMWRLWLPVRFEVGPPGVTESILSRRRRISWRKIAGYRVRRGGVVLFPPSGELCVLAPRSLFIHGGRQLDQLVAVTAFYLGEPAAEEPRQDSDSRSRASARSAAPASDAQETEIHHRDDAADRELHGDADQEAT